MGGAASTTNVDSVKPDVGAFTIPLKSLSSQLRVLQSLETGEILITIGDDFDTFSEIERFESDEWIDLTLSKLQDNYFNGIGGVLKCHALSKTRAKLDTQMSIDEYKMDDVQIPVRSQAKESKEYDDLVDIADAESDTKETVATCPFCGVKIENDGNHLLVCPTSKSVKEKFDEGDSSLQAV